MAVIPKWETLWKFSNLILKFALWNRYSGRRKKNTKNVVIITNITELTISTVIFTTTKKNLTQNKNENDNNTKEESFFI